MSIGYFSIFASFNLSPQCEGHVPCTIGTLPLVFQSRRGLYSVAATECTLPFFLVEIARF